MTHQKRNKLSADSFEQKVSENLTQIADRYLKITAVISALEASGPTEQEYELLLMNASSLEREAKNMAMVLSEAKKQQENFDNKETIERLWRTAPPVALAFGEKSLKIAGAKNWEAILAEEKLTKQDVTLLLSAN